MGKNLHFVTGAEAGARPELTGSPFDTTNMSYSSIAELKQLASRTLGIPPENWPFFMDIELEWEIPLDDVRTKCAELRRFFDGYGGELPDDYWLRLFARLLREGWDFCATI
jgi:hypothetical protein